MRQPASQSSICAAAPACSGSINRMSALDKATWREDIAAGFREAFRVLRPHGTLVFKWNETQIPVAQVIALTDQKPTIWQRTGKGDKTHWILFLKEVA